MSTALVEVVPSTVPSQLGILHLKRYWAKTKAKRLGQLASDAFEEEQPLDAALLNALELGLEPTIQYLYQVNPSFTEFETWICTSIGGLPHPDKVALFNARLLGTSPCSSNNQPPTETILSAEDLTHWHTYGYVIVKKAVSRQDCDQTIELICDFLQMDRFDPQTWYAPHPHKQGIMVQLFSIHC